MLDITTNPNINNNACMNNGSASTSLDDDMDPLFDNDWLHEHNLDILFDLFEEEMENNNKNAFQDSNLNHSTNYVNNSSTIFGSSPVTSYLFGTSPSLASALDLYDLLYYDYQQPINNTATTTNSNGNNNSTPQQHHHNQSQTIATTSNNNATTTIPISQTTSTTNNSTTNIQAIVNPNPTSTATYNINNNTVITNNNTQKSQVVTTNHIANSITNAMRIKRRFKKGQSEGISLLARPNISNISGRSCNNNNNNSINNNNINNSDKTNARLTNLKKTIINNCCSGNNQNLNSGSSSSRGIDINITKQSHHNRNKHIHYQNQQQNHHVHHITGCAVIREHAYAVRGH